MKKSENDMYKISDNNNSNSQILTKIDQAFLDSTHADGLISTVGQNYVSVRAEKYQPSEEGFFTRLKTELRSLYPGTDTVTLDWGNSYITWYKSNKTDKRLHIEVSIAHPVDEKSHAILSLDYTLGSFYKKHIDFNSMDELCEHFRRKNPYQIIDSLSEALNKYQLFTSNLTNELDIELI